MFNIMLSTNIHNFFFSTYNFASYYFFRCLLSLFLAWLFWLRLPALCWIKVAGIGTCLRITCDSALKKYRFLGPFNSFSLSAHWCAPDSTSAVYLDWLSCYYPNFFSLFSTQPSEWSFKTLRLDPASLLLSSKLSSVCSHRVPSSRVQFSWGFWTVLFSPCTFTQGVTSPYLNTVTSVTLSLIVLPLKSLYSSQQASLMFLRSISASALCFWPRYPHWLLPHFLGAWVAQ